MKSRQGRFMKGVRTGDNAFLIAFRRRNNRFVRAKRSLIRFLNSAAKDVGTRRECLEALTKFVVNEAEIEGTHYSALKDLIDSLFIHAENRKNIANFEERKGFLKDFLGKELEIRKALMRDMQRDI